MKCSACPNTDFRCPAENRPAICEAIARGDQRYIGLVDKLPPDDRLLPGKQFDVWLHTQHMAAWTGYGQIGIAVAEEIMRHGYSLVASSSRSDEAYAPLPSWVDENAKDFNPNRQEWCLMLATPTVSPMRWPKKTVFFTMWEASEIPQGSANIRLAEAIIVPCEHNREIFQRFAPDVPVHVVPIGIDTSIFYKRSEAVKREFVFGCAGRTSHGGTRKNLEFVARAFHSLRDFMPDARLEIKCFPDDKVGHLPDDDRIKVVREPMSIREMAGWYDGLSCYVTASRGEGWGMQTHQAMACGRPVIAIPWSATVDFWDERFGWAIDYRLAPADDFYSGFGAMWADPVFESLRCQMLEAYVNIEEVARRGDAAAKRAAEFTWARTGDGVLAVLEAAGAIPSRDAPALPSWGRMASQGLSTGAAALVTGFRPASEAAQGQRWAICRACSSFRATDERCGGEEGCGCHLRKKITLAASECPVGRWRAEPA